MIEFVCPNENIGFNGDNSVYETKLMNLKQELRLRSKNFEHPSPQVTIKDDTARGLVRLHFTNDMYLPP